MAEFAGPAALGDVPTPANSDGVSMSEAEIDSFLSEQGTGILSLSAQGEAYAVPESFGYDSGTLYFLLADHDDSRKMAYIDQTTTACFVTYEMSTVDEWASVLVRGDVVPTPDRDQERAAAALAQNAEIPDAGLFGFSSDEINFSWYEIDPTERSGKQAPTR